MKKVLLIIGGLVLGLVVLVFTIFGITYLTSQKLQCESSAGSISIMYNDEKLTGYAANGMGFDFDTQNEYAQQLGVEKYLDEFASWFKLNTGGTCVKK